MPITRINSFTALPGKAEELLKALAAILPHIRAAEGCLHVQLLVSTATPEQIAVIETWQSAEAHKAATINIDPADFQTIMAMLAAPPSGTNYNQL